MNVSYRSVSRDRETHKEPETLVCLKKINIRYLDKKYSLISNKNNFFYINYNVDKI